jgi:signal transduction histidine kinase/predicted negative regulator of RcsB-dependent stress response
MFLCHTHSAQTIFDTLNTKLKDELRPSDKLTYILNYCELHVDKNPRQIKTILDDAKDYIIENELHHRNAEYFYQCANYYTKIHLFDSAQSYYSKSLTNVADNNLIFKSLLHTRLASTNRNKFEFEQAIANIELALNFSKLSNNNTSFADALLELGNIYGALDMYNLALNNHQDAIDIFKNHKDTLMVIEGYLQIGNLFVSWGNFPMAIDYYDKALTLNQKMKLTENVSATYLLMSKVYYKMGDITESIRYCELANVNYQENAFKKAPCLNQLGLIEIKRNNFDQSNELLNKGLDIYNKNNDLLGKAEVCTNKGDLFVARNKYPEAISKYKEALTITEEISAQSLRLTLLEKLVESNSKLPDHKSALNFQTQYYVLNQKKISDIAQLKLSILENNLNVEKKGLAAGQAELLQELTKERLSKKKWIFSVISLFLSTLIIFAFYYLKTQKILAEKNVLLANKLQRLNRQQEYLQNMKSQIEELNKTLSLVFSVTTLNINEAVKKLRELIDLSNSTTQNNDLLLSKVKSETFIMSYNLLENLLYFSKLQLEKIEIEPDDIEIKPLLHDVLRIQQPRALAKKIEISVSIEDKLWGYFDYQLIEVALRNIVENAIKFSTFESTVQILAKKDMDAILISISDNGIGLTRDQLTRTLSPDKNYISQGTHGEKGGGLGLHLSKIFIDRNFGFLHIESSIAIGTKVLIKLPGSKNSLIKSSSK